MTSNELVPVHASRSAVGLAAVVVAVAAMVAAPGSAADASHGPSTSLLQESVMARSRVSVGRQLAGVVACVLGCTLPTDSVEQIVANETGGGAVDTALVPIADTYIVGDFPNANYGTSDDLWVGNGPKRTLVRFDEAAIAAAVGTGTLVSAQLELTITVNPWGWGMARPVDVHRLTQAWTEGGATWHCADDAVPGDSTPDCPEAGWEMDPEGPNPWEATPTASVMMSNGMTGVVPFDVTADVAAFLAEAVENHGWVVKSANEALTGRVVFGAREGEVQPRLVLAVQPADTSRPPIPAFGYPLDSLFLVTPPDDSVLIYYRRLASVWFTEEASGTQVSTFFTSFDAAIVGGLPFTGGYIVQFPDPGANWDQYDSVLTQMRNAPGVRSVIGVKNRDYPPHVDARYPDDGGRLSRTSWFDENEFGPWAYRAVRAPLAWGCETGTYEANPPAVGIVEFRFDVEHPQLAASSPSIFTGQQAPTTAPQDSIDLWERHGTAVSGLISALGDDGAGVPGIIWRSDLHLYALGEFTGTRLQDNLHAFLEEVLPAIASDQVGILNLSIEIGAGNFDELDELEQGIRTLLDRSPQTLIVKAVGNFGMNDRFAGSVVAQSFGARSLRSALARLYDNGFSDRILFVGGTRPGNQLWTGSSFLGGMTDLAAPAESVAVLGLRRLEEDVRLSFGTSFATAMVSGAGAQLLAMDSTLTAAEVKDYILRGAQEPRLNPNTGQMDPPDPVQGAPETVYQLDAYGALSLLSKERAGTPICGVEVSFEGQTITIHRNQPETKTIPGAGADPAINPYLSVAQGGRLIAVNNPDGSGVLQFNHRVDPSSVVPFPDLFARSFLERDTLDLAIPDTALQVTLRRVNGQVVGPVELAPRTAPSAADARVHQVIAAPFGDWAAVQTLWSDGAGFTFDRQPADRGRPGARQQQHGDHPGRVLRNGV